MDGRLKDIEREVLNCKKCSLFKERINPVFGEGDSCAKIMLIGEAPGANENMKGRPFCGKAGEVLDELLSKAGIKREDIYITNILNAGLRKIEIPKKRR